MVLPVTVTGWRDRAVTNCDPSQKNDDPMLREISMPIMPAESVAVPEIDEAFALVTFTCAAAVPEQKIKIAPAKPEVFNVSLSKRLQGRFAAWRLTTKVADYCHFNKSN